MNQKRIKKQHLAVIIAGLAILVAGTSVLNSSFAASSNPNQYVAHISPESAANIAIHHISAQPSNLVKVDLDNENGVHVYSVEFIIGDQEVSVEIDPQTGDVKRVEQHMKDVSDGDGETADDATESNVSNEPATGDGDGETADDATESNVSNEPATGDGDGETADD